jgi:hypothetical protein
MLKQSAFSLQSSSPSVHSSRSKMSIQNQSSIEFNITITVYIRIKSDQHKVFHLNPGYIQVDKSTHKIHRYFHMFHYDMDLLHCLRIHQHLRTWWNMTMHTLFVNEWYSPWHESLSLAILYPKLQPHSTLSLDEKLKQVQLVLSWSHKSGSIFISSAMVKCNDCLINHAVYIYISSDIYTKTNLCTTFHFQRSLPCSGIHNFPVCLNSWHSHGRYVFQFRIHRYLNHIIF